MLGLDTGDTRLIIDKGRTFGLLRNQLAYVLATAALETNYTMKPVKEAYWLPEDWRKRKLEYYPWYGRGYAQLTWEENYLRASEELGVDLISDPDLAMEPAIASKVLVKGCRDGWFTGRKLSDFITLKRSDFRNARQVVNGMDRAETIAAFAEDYDEALLAEGYGVDPAPGAMTPDDLLAAYMAHEDIPEGSPRYKIADGLRGLS